MMGTCECGNEPSGSTNSGNFLTSCKPVSFSRRTLLHGVSKKVYQCVTVNIVLCLVFHNIVTSLSAAWRFES